MRIIYTFSICLYTLGIRLMALFNNKASLWVNGRKNIFSELQENINPNKPLVWFHAASLGEFEQGRPVIEAYRKLHPYHVILLTFYSPSGFEIRKNYEYADYICYLPADTQRNAKRFIALTKPTVAFFIKYEFWFNYIFQLDKQNIPTYIFSSIFRKQQHFFQWYGAWFLKHLRMFNHIFVQNKESVQLLKQHGISSVSLSGDTRFDRVYSVAQQKKSFPLIAQFKGDSSLFMAGSSWEPDEDLIIAMIKKNIPGLKFVFAPHEVHSAHIENIIGKLSGTNHLLFSKANENNIKQADILIIDSIGILLHLYQYSTITYIGGGFGKCIHNILEAATFGNPVIFGPSYHKFQEAHDLIAKGGAYCIHNAYELESITMKLLSDHASRDCVSLLCSDYVKENKGATDIILKQVSMLIHA